MAAKKKTAVKKKAAPKKKAARRKAPPRKKAARNSTVKAAKGASRKTVKSKAPAGRSPPGDQGQLFDAPPAPEISHDKLLVPLNVAALAFGISIEALKKWRVPARMKVGRESLYDLRDLIEYRMKRADANENQLASARAALARAQQEKTEIEIAQLRGELIPADVILENWTPLVGAARQKVLAIKTKIKTQIPKLTQRDLQKVDKICRAALEDLANGGLPRAAKRVTRATL